MLRSFRNLKFRTKLFLICLMISLVPTIILGIFCYSQLRTLLIERERTVLRDSVIQESLNISSQLNSYETLSEYIIWDSNLIDMLNRTYETNSQMYRAYVQDVEPFFNTLKHLNPGIAEIIIYTDLEIYPRTGVLEPLSKIESFPWYPEISGNIQSLWVHSAEDRHLSVVQRFVDIPRDISAFIRMQINQEKLFSRLTTLFTQSYGITLMDADGSLIWQYHTDDLAIDDIPLPDLSNHSLSDSSQNDYIIETTVDQHTGWTYYIFRPAETVLEPTLTIISTVLAMIILCLIVVFLFSYWLSHSLVHPLEKLAKNMDQVAQGNYEIKVVPQSSDEVGQLIQNFTDMVQTLNQLINETLKAKITQQKLEFRALQAQINPHFLYNTLSLINSQSIISGHPEIGLPARYMATFYRTSLNKGNDLISVKDELENIKAYINIQLIMHSDNFNVHYDIDEDILAYTMPNLMLQPLVENAIIHGFDGWKSDRRGCLKITAKSSGDNLIFRIADNGCGISEEKLATILTRHSSSYGVENVHTRAQLQYGQDYGLQYKSQAGYGTEVTLTIPKQVVEADT